MDRAQPVSGTGHEKRDASRIKLLSPGEISFYSKTFYFDRRNFVEKIIGFDNFSKILLIRDVYLFIIIIKELKSFDLRTTSKPKYRLIDNKKFEILPKILEKQKLSSFQRKKGKKKKSQPNQRLHTRSSLSSDNSNPKIQLTSRGEI